MLAGRELGVQMAVLLPVERVGRLGLCHRNHVPAQSRQPPMASRDITANRHFRHAEQGRCFANRNHAAALHSIQQARDTVLSLPSQVHLPSSYSQTRLKV